MPGSQSRWSEGKESLVGAASNRAGMRGEGPTTAGQSFRHAAVFLRWRADKRPIDWTTAARGDHPSSRERLRCFRPVCHPGSPTMFAAARVRPIVETIVRVERLLFRPERVGHVLQVDADPRPGLKRPRIASTSTSAGSRWAAASGDESSTVRDRPTRPALLRAPDFDERVPGHASPRRLHPRRLAGLLLPYAAATVHRRDPRARGRPKARAGCRASTICQSIPAWRSPPCAKPAGIVVRVKSADRQSVDLVPEERRRHAPVRRGPYRVHAGDRAVLGVLVVVEEDALALHPPLARRQPGGAPFDLAREGERSRTSVNVQRRSMRT